MDEKDQRFIVTFHTTAEAMALEDLCRAKNLKGRLISAPRSLSPDCGIAWSAPPEEAGKIKAAVKAEGLEVHAFHIIEA